MTDEQKAINENAPPIGPQPVSSVAAQAQPSEKESIPYPFLPDGLIVAARHDKLSGTVYRAEHRDEEDRLVIGGGWQPTRQAATAEAWAIKCEIMTAQQPVSGTKVVPNTIEQLAVYRYRPVPSGLIGYKVVAGDGSRSLFSGTKNECYIVARKLTEAFLDGAYVALKDQQPVSGADGLPALVEYLRQEADFNRSWVDGRRGSTDCQSPEYITRRMVLAARADTWADAVAGLIATQPFGNSGELPADWREQFKEALYERYCAMDNQDFPLEDYPSVALEVLEKVVGPRHPAVVTWRNDAINACISIAYKYCRDPDSFKYLKQDLQALITAQAQPLAQQDADPLQGAADWLVRDCGVSDPAGLANRLGIGYNRASRLVDAARKEQE